MQNSLTNSDWQDEKENESDEHLLKTCFPLVSQRELLTGASSQVKNV